jgi:hypothetical protein
MPVRKILRLYALAFAAGVALTFLVATLQGTLTARSVGDIAVGVGAVIVLIGLSLLGSGSSSSTQAIEELRASEDPSSLDNCGRGVLLIAAAISWALIANVVAGLLARTSQHL